MDIMSLKSAIFFPTYIASYYLRTMLKCLSNYTQVERRDEGCVLKDETDESDTEDDGRRPTQAGFYLLAYCPRWGREGGNAMCQSSCGGWLRVF